ncbi:hypothetical protein [Oceanobacillus saliphilus]|uniref:hypothetical protein n=1 Tax=Oceanobacillus saliphilus TaxID=2925834 RepID=UPI00201E0568|nr:hypothetical protein [Oceanobacillus saliphilus]
MHTTMPNEVPVRKKSLFPVSQMIEKNAIRRHLLKQIDIALESNYESFMKQGAVFIISLENVPAKNQSQIVTLQVGPNSSYKSCNPTRGKPNSARHCSVFGIL